MRRFAGRRIAGCGSCVGLLFQALEGMFRRVVATSLSARCCRLSLGIGWRKNLGPLGQGRGASEMHV